MDARSVSPVTAKRIANLYGKPENLSARKANRFPRPQQLRIVLGFLDYLSQFLLHISTNDQIAVKILEDCKRIMTWKASLSECIRIRSRSFDSRRRKFLSRALSVVLLRREPPPAERTPWAPVWEPAPPPPTPPAWRFPRPPTLTPPTPLPPLLLLPPTPPKPVPPPTTLPQREL